MKTHRKKLITREAVERLAKQLCAKANDRSQGMVVALYSSRKVQPSQSWEDYIDAAIAELLAQGYS